MKFFKWETKEEKKQRLNKIVLYFGNFNYAHITKELAEKYIRDYWVAGLVMLIISVALHIVLGQVVFFVFDTMIMGLLISCIYKKIRWAGVAFFVYFLAGKITLFATYPQYINIGSVIMSLVFFRFFYLGTLGLFKWRQENQSNY